MIIGLRHDVDNVYGLRRGLPKVVSLEEKYGVRSTFFVRVDVLSDSDCRVLKQIASRGWEIGLHLINTVNGSELLPPEDELKLLKKLLDVPIYGVTPCGHTIGFKGDVTWKVMDFLGLTYMEGYGVPDFKVNTFVTPTHLSFDIFYVAKFGEDDGYTRFRKDLLHMLKKDGIATVLVHPEWFVRSVGVRGLKRIMLTFLRRKMMNKVYDRFLYEFNGRVEFLRYIDLYQRANKGKSLA